MVKIKTFVFNPFQENTYIIYDESKKCLIIDPGCYYENEQGILSGFISDHELEPEYLVHTHGHIDHVLGVEYIRNTYKISAIIHKDDLEILRRTREFGSMVGVEIQQPSDPELFIAEGEKITFGNTSFDVLHIPGHSPGSIALYNEQEAIVFVGDTLFKKGIGRTDLMGGNYITLIENIKNKLLTLPENTIVYSGHGEATTIGSEKAENPVLL